MAGQVCDESEDENWELNIEPKEKPLYSFKVSDPSIIVVFYREMLVRFIVAYHKKYIQAYRLADVCNLHGLHSEIKFSKWGYDRHRKLDHMK